MWFNVYAVFVGDWNGKGNRVGYEVYIIQKDNPVNIIKIYAKCGLNHGEFDWFVSKFPKKGKQFSES